LRRGIVREAVVHAKDWTDYEQAFRDL